MDRRRNDPVDDSPIYSRLFVVCGKYITEEDLESAFSPFGTIEDIKIVRQHGSNDSKGIAYIKFTKTSDAAIALESLHLKPIGSVKHVVKVLVATNRSEIQSDDDNKLKYRRLFISIPKTHTESDIEEAFKQFGEIQSILIHRDRSSGESKGFAYVTFSKFSEAARAYEDSDRKYRAIFATPKSAKRHETSFESNIDFLSKSTQPKNSMISMMEGRSRGFTRVDFMCWPQLTQMHVERLFDLVPGLVGCKYYVDLMRNIGKGTATYSNPDSAAYAVDKLNNFEYPPGMAIFVKPDTLKFNAREESNIGRVPETVSKLKNAIEFTANSASPDLVQLAEAIAEASKLIKKATGGTSNRVMPESTDINYCSVKLPPPQPLADIDSPLAKRCFLVCKPAPPPLAALRDVFCRFGDLINVYTLPNKTVGYARYASVQAADEAIKYLHGAEICGVRMKVLEAEDEAPPRKRRYDMMDSDY